MGWELHRHAILVTIKKDTAIQTLNAADVLDQ